MEQFMLSNELYLESTYFRKLDFNENGTIFYKKLPLKFIGVFFIKIKKPLSMAVIRRNAISEIESQSRSS